MEPNSKRSKMSEQDLDLIIFNVWGQHEQNLRTCKRNAEVYEQMARETNGRFTAQELNLKIRSLREKYRAEKLRMEALNGSVSKWLHFDRVQQIIEGKTQQNYTHTAPFAFAQIKTDPLDESLAVESIDMPDFSPIPSPSSLSSADGSFKRKPKSKRKESTEDETLQLHALKRKEWTDFDTAQLLPFWEKYAAVLRSTKHNSHIYIKIAREMKKFNAREVRTKVNNLMQKYRKEKKESEALGKPSMWVHYEYVGKILTNPSYDNPTETCAPFQKQQLSAEDQRDLENLKNLKKNRSSSRNNWDPDDNLLVIDIWAKYASELRKTRRNSHIYAKIAKEMNGKFTPREVHTKISNLIQRFRTEKKSGWSSSTKWEYYDQVQRIIEDIGNNCEQNSNMACFSSLDDQTQSNSVEFCSPMKVSSPLPDDTPKSSCSFTSEHVIPETVLETMSSSDSESLETFSHAQKSKNASFQEEILETMKRQTDVMQKLSDQNDKQLQFIENLNSNLEKFLERQAESNKAFMDILQKLLEK